jgi:hypothetical protein
MTKSIGRFQEAFNKVIEEDSSTAGALGGSPGGFNPAAGKITSSDSYAPGDTRNATPPGVIQKRTGEIKIKSKRTRKRTKRRTQKRGTTAL